MPTPTDATNGAAPQAGAGDRVDPGPSVDAWTDRFVFNPDRSGTADVDRVEEIEATLVATAPLRRPTPWLRIALIAACLCAAAAGWLFHRIDLSDPVATAASPAAQSGGELAQERQRSKELEQQLAARQGDQEALAHERARSQGLEQRLAALENDQEVQQLLARERTRDQAIAQQMAAQRDQDALAKERAHSRVLEQQLAARQRDDKALAQERARSKELEQQHLTDEKALAEERARGKGLERQLAARQDGEEALAEERARRKGLEQQLAARQSDEMALAQERARSKELEQQLAIRQDNEKALARERARSLALERELAERRNTVAIPPPTLDFTSTWLTLAPPDLNPAPPLRIVRAATPMPAVQSDKPALVQPVAALAPAQPPQASGNAEAIRLMARAKLLLDQGDVSAARIVLERAAETGSAPALFSLAETYDPAVLSAWGTFGTQGDAAKAQKLYADAFAAGFVQAKERLRASR